MKKGITIAICLAMTIVSVVGCGKESTKQEVKQDIDVTTYYVKHKFPEEKLNETETLITSPAGSILSTDTKFVKYDLMDSQCDKKGRIEKVEYSTDVYEDGKTYDKYVNVYLPSDYDENRTEPYNVLYFQHGNKLSNDYFLQEEYKNRLDNLFASGKVDPVILVFTTYYLEPDKADEIRKTEPDAPAGDGNYTGVPANFWKEVVEDIIPTVEAKYNTYAESFDLDGLIASRDHRGFSGYSRGSCCTWYMFHSALPYFKWWAPMSASCVAGKQISENPTDEEAYQYLKEAVDDNPDMDFFIYVGSGGPTDAGSLRTQMAYFEKQPIFSYGDDPKTNNLYYVLSNFEHGDLYAPYYYYNSLQVLFQN